MSTTLKCPECGGNASPGQEQCDYCGMWFETAPASSPIARIMADSAGDKPKERFVYYTGGVTDFGPSIGVSVGGGLSVPLGGGGAHKTVGRITGTVVEETSEYVIIMTGKGQLVKIRPENIIKRKPITPSSAEQKQRLRQGALRGIITGALFTFAGITFLTGSYLRGSSPALLLGAGMAVFGLVLLLMMWGVYSKNQSSSQ